MTNQSEFNFAEPEGDYGLLLKVFNQSTRILIKKLSNNDRDWARNKNKHQAGVYIPRDQREGGFFLPLERKVRKKIDAPAIYERRFTTYWEQYGEKKDTGLIHYTSKGQETHMTTLPKEAFMDLSPSSYLVMGRESKSGEYSYNCLTIDSASEDAEYLRALFELDPDFLIGEFSPGDIESVEKERVLDFTDQVIHAWATGNIVEFSISHAKMPDTTELSRLARVQYLKSSGLESINPFELSAPGDVLRKISRSIEWDLFREYQRRERSVQLVRVILGDTPTVFDSNSIIRRLIDEFPKIDALMLSASQQRKSRAGYSYENHIQAMLEGGGIPFEKQVVIQAKKRPDFVLPSLAYLEGKNIGTSGLILSAKTTLRERWKQVEREKGKRDLYLTTVDENIANNAIEDMASIGIQLVIPESLKKTKMTEYQNHSNVLTFKEFCENVVKPKLSDWRNVG